MSKPVLAPGMSSAFTLPVYLMALTLVSLEDVDANGGAKLGCQGLRYDRQVLALHTLPLTLGHSIIDIHNVRSLCLASTITTTPPALSQ